MISPFLLHLINNILTCSKYPLNWKHARVVPIPKNGKLDYENIRPISILPAMSKVIENLMKSQILSYIDRYHLINSSQYAFQRNLNTTSLLLSLTESVRGKLDTHLLCTLVSLDLTKAFDRINHATLISKLGSNFNFSRSACKLVLSYLSDRSQYVTYNGSSSSVSYLSSGVPQGSILGPVLFLIYINDFLSILNNNFCQSFVFADDVMLLFSGARENVNEVESYFNGHLNLISDWMLNNFLSINPSKTRAINFNLSDRNIFCPNLLIDGVPIQYVESMKCLGVILDSKLNFSQHIDAVTKTSCITLRRLYSLKSYTPQHIRYRLASSLIMSRVNYCLEVYSATLSGNVNRIEAIIRKITRYVFNIGIREHSRTSELVPTFLKCSFKDYLNLRILLHFYKIIKTGKPSQLVNTFTFTSSTRNVQINVPLGRTSLFDRSFVKRVYRSYRTLPSELKLFSYSYSTYMRKLLIHFNVDPP